MEQVQGYLSEGNITAQDFLWYDSQIGWIPAGQVPGFDVPPHQNPAETEVVEANVNQSNPTNCPNCNNSIEAGQAVCIECGFSVQSGESVGSTQVLDQTKTDIELVKEKDQELKKKFKTSLGIILGVFALIWGGGSLLAPASFAKISDVLLIVFGVVLFLILLTLICIMSYAKLMIAQEKYRKKILFKIGITYTILVIISATLLLLQLSMVLLVLSPILIPVVIFSPNYHMENAPRINGIYEENWDDAFATNVIHNVYPWAKGGNLNKITSHYEDNSQGLYWVRVWEEEKLVFWKEWRHNEYGFQQNNLMNYGYSFNGTTKEPLRIIPAPYRLKMDPRTLKNDAGSQDSFLASFIISIFDSWFNDYRPHKLKKK